MPMCTLEDGPPKHAHLACSDGSWWHDDPTRRDCFVGYTHLSAAHVETCFYGSALERGAAIARLTAGDLMALFRHRCACGANHRVLAENLARAYRAVQPGAREAASRLGPRDLIALGAVRGDTPEETQRKQILKTAAMLAARSGVRKRKRALPVAA